MLPSPPSSLHYLKEIFITRGMADLYYTAGGLEKKEWRTDRQRTDREQRTDTPITEATLIPMDCWVEQTNNINHR